MVQMFNMKAANQPCVLLLGLPLVSRPVLLRLAWLHFPGFELSSSVIECHQCMVYSWMAGKHTGVSCVLNKYHKSKLPRASRTSNTRQVSVLCTDNWPCLRSNCDLRTRNRKAKYVIASHIYQIQQAERARLIMSSVEIMKTPTQGRFDGRRAWKIKDCSLFSKYCK